jgi:drug/metabolite transporter (DMT)-like permease
VINQLLFIKGLSLTYSIHASLLMLTTPIFITIIAAWILKEKLSFNKILGLTLGVTGAVILMLHKKNSGSGSNVLWGDIFVILNAISYSYYFVLVKPLMKRYHPITVMRILFTMGVLIAFPFCWSEFSATPWTEYHSTQFVVLFLIIFCGTFLAYTFNVYGIKHLGASVSGTYIYSQPIFASIIAILMLGEVLDMYKIISAALIFVGVFLNNKSVSND